MIKVGINGFGRIGRMVFRAIVENFSKDVQVVGINDLLEPAYLAYMLKYDSVHGRFNHDVKVEGNFLIVNGNRIRLTAEREPSNLKWNEVGAEVVIESTGLFLTDEKSRQHIAAGTKKGMALSLPQELPFLTVWWNYIYLSLKCPSMLSISSDAARRMASREQLDINFLRFAQPHD